MYSVTEKSRAKGVPHLRKLEVGNRLRASRLALKLTLAEVAKEVEMSKSALSSYENGRRTIDAFILADLCLVYGVSTDYILYGTHMVPEDLRVLFQRNGAARRDP